MEVQGKIIVDLGEQTGVSKAGNNWKKHEYVLETHDTYPKKVHFDFFGERADQYPLSVGDEVTLSFDIESREYMGRWYTSIRGWKAEKAAATAPQGAPQEIPGGFPPPPMEPIGGDSNSDLPF
ncbi:MAG: DUF3127 domain-containing protein [Clostridium sp.]|nr:DUF3127 domain-containing protein [Clostridium sp.]